MPNPNPNSGNYHNTKSDGTYYYVNNQSPNAYYYSNSNGSYHYKNENGSSYYNNPSTGTARYTAPNGYVVDKSSYSGNGGGRKN
ncbi:hypothetical protein BGZ82_002533 [Podila clonocystis]|nr:hypothetical protein BGZ82_002533 [Podila clonocystis]